MSAPPEAVLDTGAALLRPPPAMAIDQASRSSWCFARVLPTLPGPHLQPPPVPPPPADRGLTGRRAPAPRRSRCCATCGRRCPARCRQVWTLWRSSSSPTASPTPRTSSRQAGAGGAQLAPAARQRLAALPKAGLASGHAPETLYWQALSKLSPLLPCACLPAAQAGSQAWVLRKKPPGRILASAHAVEREARVLQALGATPVPVPRVVRSGTCRSGGARRLEAWPAAAGRRPQLQAAPTGPQAPPLAHPPTRPLARLPRSACARTRRCWARPSTSCSTCAAASSRIPRCPAWPPPSAPPCTRRALRLRRTLPCCAALCCAAPCCADTARMPYPAALRLVPGQVRW